MSTDNILVKEDKSMSAIVTPRGHKTAVSKMDKYNWAHESKPGKFRMVSKQDLNIDGSYQREQKGATKVIAIARDWDWKLFGALSVIQREDGSFWVYDGGHRVRAAFYRKDINKLPCMVFDSDGVHSEARVFVGANTMHSVVSAYSKHKASVVAEEPLAVAVEALTKKHGYTPKPCYSNAGDFCAISTLSNMVRLDPDLADKVFELCCEICDYDGSNITGTLMIAMYTCEKSLVSGSLFSSENTKKLKMSGLEGIGAAITRQCQIIGQGGAKIGAKGILDLLNKKRKRKLNFK